MRRAFFFTALVALGLVTMIRPAPAERLAHEKPPGLEDLEVTEHLGAAIPLDLTFRDESNRAVQLKDYVRGQKPVILTLNYYDCPMLCTRQLNGMIHGLKGIPWTAGQEFEIVTVSISPTETPELAAAKKTAYLKEYARPSAAAGWHFLTGTEANITALADAAGFGYGYDPATKQYLHPAVAMMLSPDGVLVRYLYGMTQQPSTMKLALVEAGEGTIGTPLDRVILSCFTYDPAANSYVFTALWIMRIGGLLTVLLIGGFILRSVLKERRPHKPGAAEAMSAGA